jgi:preprotein translocase subunit SecG
MNGRRAGLSRRELHVARNDGRDGAGSFGAGSANACLRAEVFRSPLLRMTDVLERAFGVCAVPLGLGSAMESPPQVRAQRDSGHEVFSEALCFIVRALTSAATLQVAAFVRTRIFLRRTLSYRPRSYERGYAASSCVRENADLFPTRFVLSSALLRARLGGR